MIDQLISRTRSLLRDDRGNYIAQQIVGATVSLLVMGAVTMGILSTTAIQATIASRAVVTQQATSTEAALRSDVNWASAILPGNAAGERADEFVRFIIPGRDARCQESTWHIRKVTDNFDGVQVDRVELVNQVANYDTYDTSTTPVTCTGTRQLSAEQVMISAASDDARFDYSNAGGRKLELLGAGNRLFDATTGKPKLAAGAKPARVSPLDWDSHAVKTVGLETTVGTGSELETEYVFRETAVNLHKGRSAPADRDGEVTERYFQDHASLLG